MKYKKTAEHIEKIRLSNLGKKRTPETIAKMRILRAKPRPGGHNPKSKVQCPHCLREIAINMSTRWHFNNCKEKK